MPVSVVTCGFGRAAAGLASAASGKSGSGSAAVQVLREVVDHAKTADPMAQVTVLVPSNRAGLAARRALAAGVGGRPGVAGIEVTTIHRLAERIAGPGLAARRPITSPVLAAAMRSAVQRSTGPFLAMADHSPTISALAAAHAELRMVGTATLAAIEQSSTVAGAVVDLHRQVTARLQPDWYDLTDTLTVAAKQAGDLGLGQLVLYLPGRTTKIETAFLSAVSAHNDLVIIAGLTGVVRADAATRQTCGRLGVTVDDKPAVPVADKIINATDSDDEIRCVLGEVMAALVDTPADRIAILYANASPYARLLHDQLRAAGITFNGDGTRPLAERAIPRLLMEILALGGDIPRADLFRALSQAPVQDFSGDRIPVSRWERISRSAGIVAGDDWPNRLNAYLADRRAEIAAEQADDDPDPARIDRLTHDLSTATALRDFVHRLRQELQQAEDLTTWSELAAWCGDLISSLLGSEQQIDRLPPEEQSATAAVHSTLQSAAALDGVEPAADLNKLRGLLDTELSTRRPRVGRFGEGIFVGPISAAVGLDLDQVYVVGLSEDLYPGPLRTDPLLGNRARAAAAGELMQSSELLNQRHQRLLAAVGAGRRTVVSFPRGDLRRSSSRLPSRFLLGSLRELSGDHRLAATDWDKINYPAGVETADSFAGRLLTTPMMATEQEWRIRTVAAGATLDDGAVRAATEMISARSGRSFTRYDGNLAGLPGLPDYAAGQQPISPTGLEAYAECPHGFFVKRLLGVQPIEQPEDIVVISALEIGNLIHQCMDELVTEYADRLPGYGEPWTADQRERLRELTRAKAEDFTRRGLTGHPRLWEVQRRQILQDVDQLLIEDDHWRRERMARVAASELPFGLQGAEPVEIPVPGGTVLMRGSADKIDIGADDRIYVTDLKTGGRSRYQGISQETPFAEGTRLQLPVYGHAARAQLGSPDTPVTAMYWFVRKDPKRRLELELTPEVESGYAAVLGTLVRAIAGGIFPAKAPDQPDFDWVQCAYCNPDGIGHEDVRRRWERQRSDPLLRELVALIDAPGEGGHR